MPESAAADPLRMPVPVRVPAGGVGTAAALRPGAGQAAPLPVLPVLHDLLPQGLRRGSALSVTGSLSLVLALLGAASARGAWCALVGLPRVSAEALAEYGITLSRLAVVPRPGPHWTTAIGALVDAVDIVVARPPTGRAAPAPADVRRLSARVRTRDAVLLAYSPTGGSAPVWPGAEVRIDARDASWTGIGSGHGRLRERRLLVRVEGRGAAARPRSAELLLPAAGGGVARPGAAVLSLPA